MDKLNRPIVKTTQDDERAAEVARLLLEGTYFESFSFSTHFSLRFSREARKTHDGVELPAEVELVLHSEWRIGDQVSWKEKVDRLAPEGAVEPEEPVQAWSLADLRWTDGAGVEAVAVKEDTLEIRFKNDHVLVAAHEVDDGDASWIIRAAGEPEPSISWSVVSEGGELFVRAPHKPG